MHEAINDSENKEWTRTTVHDWTGKVCNPDATGTGRVRYLALTHLAYTLTAPVRRVYVHLGLRRAEVDAWYKGRQGWYEVTWEDLYPDPRGYPKGTLETLAEYANRVARIGEVIEPPMVGGKRSGAALIAQLDFPEPPEEPDEWTAEELSAMAVNPEIESEDL